MVFSIEQEVLLLLYSVLAGVFISVIYDFFRVIRKKSDSGIFFSNIQDTIFLITAVIIMFFVIFSKSNGIFRFYQILGALLGAFFYYITLSRLVRFFILKVIGIFLKIFEFFLKILLTPIRFMYKIVYVFISFLFSVTIFILKRIKRFFVRRYRDLRRIILKK